MLVVVVVGKLEELIMRCINFLSLMATPAVLVVYWFLVGSGRVVAFLY